MESGELEPRSLAAQVLLRSVVYAEDAAQSGQPLGDWDALESSGSIATTLETTFERFEHWKLSWNNKSSKSKFSKNFFIVQLRARQIITFLQAHKLARQIFKEEFSQVGRSCLTSAEETVLDESSLEVDQAKEALADLPKEDLAVAESLLLCSILLNKSANYFNKLAHRGLMSPREAGEFLEHIEENLKTVRHTSEIDRTKELSTTAKRTRMSQVDPQTLGLDPELTKGLLSGS